MTNETFAQQNPAYAVLYTPEPDDRWRARVIDIPECEAFGDGSDLRKEPTAYAVLYTPEAEGHWRARVVDIPGCEVSRPGVALAKIAARERVKNVLEKCRQNGQPMPAATSNICYVRPNSQHRGLGGKSATEALGEVLKAYREAHGTLPPAVSVCGYVNPEAKEDDQDA